VQQVERSFVKISKAQNMQPANVQRLVNLDLGEGNKPGKNLGVYARTLLTATYKETADNQDLGRANAHKIDFQLELQEAVKHGKKSSEAGPAGDIATKWLTLVVLRRNAIPESVRKHYETLKSETQQEHATADKGRKKALEFLLNSKGGPERDPMWEPEDDDDDEVRRVLAHASVCFFTHPTACCQLAPISPAFPPPPPITSPHSRR